MDSLTQKRVYKSVTRREAIPESVDWRQKTDVVTPIKDQEKDGKPCLSCWAFSACVALEGQLKLKKNKSVNLSPQHLVDCAYQRSGCDTGWIGKGSFYLV